MESIFYLTSILLLVYSSSMAQLDLKYQEPVKSILDLADAPMPPTIRINNKGTKVILLSRNRFKSIVELSEPELRLGGLRINPKLNIGSRVRYNTGISIMKVGQKEEIQPEGLPEKGRFANFSWSPDEKYMAFTNTSLTGVELWLLNIDKNKVVKLTQVKLNANIGQSFTWFRDGKSLLVHFLPKDKKELISSVSSVPVGPTVSVNNGQKAQNGTYQDLLKNKVDEFNFEQLLRSELYKVTLIGDKTLWKEAAMYKHPSFSPDGNYILDYNQTFLLYSSTKPFSYKHKSSHTNRQESKNNNKRASYRGFT